MQLLFNALFLLIGTGLPAENPQADTREILDLSGTWLIAADEEDRGKDERWFLPEVFDSLSSKSIDVPSGWESVLGIDFDGVAWYGKGIEMPATASADRLLLRFQGAATEARVWVNGKLAGEHLGAWTPFTLDITDLAEPGARSLIVVRLDEKVGHSTQGFLPIVAPHFGGLWQSVSVIRTGEASIDGDAIHVNATDFEEDGAARLAVRIPIRGSVPMKAKVRLGLLHDGRPLPGPVQAPVQGDVITLEWSGGIEPWEPGRPALYTVLLELLDENGAVIDTVTKRVGFRRVETDGPRILLNGRPIIVRGFLTWGCAPPEPAPRFDPAEFRETVRYFRDCGFNLIKFCLWLPPKELLDIVDEEGMLAWIEYPTWHARLDKNHEAELLREYREMSNLDATHPCVILRSVTCETGPSADLDVLQKLYDLLKEQAPATLVEDDSSWIGWNRIHDFWDDHTYSSNHNWRDQMNGLDAYRKERRMLPLLLGEAMAADTWVDIEALTSAAGDEHPWWWPRWLDSQIAFEKKLRERFTMPGFDPVRDLHEVSLDYAMEQRRWQIETYREMLPHSGYVVSVIHDVRLCAMGLLDFNSRPKWPVEAWSWHGEHTASLAKPGDQRAFLGAPDKPRRETSRRRMESNSGETGEVTWPTWILPEAPSLQDGTVCYGMQKEDAWETLFDGARSAGPRSPIDPDIPVVITTFLDREILDYLESGGRVLHLVSKKTGSFKRDDLWFLRGTVWAPACPEAFFEAVPRDLLQYLQNFELGGSGVVRGERLWEQVDPLLTHIETHDLETVRPNLLLFQTGVGRGRLMVSCLEHTGGPDLNYAGLWLARILVQYLVEGEPPTRSLDAQLLSELASALNREIRHIETPWRFSKDVENDGLERNWQAADFDDSVWESLFARTAREGTIWNAYDGWGWYRQTLEIPANWSGRRIRLVLDSVDDLYELYVNGRLAGSHGKLDRSETSYLNRTWVDVTEFLTPGEPNLFVLRIHDWVGGGGLNGPAWLLTGDADPDFDLLQR